MKVIISRKGFDSQYGGQPSTIMPDGTLLSLPIPAKNEIFKFSDIKFEGKTYLQIIKELNPRTKIKDNYTCHLDPDLRKDVIHREKGWLPLFGQTGASQGHLSKQGVKEGDLFLFFGTFRQAEWGDGILRYKNNCPEVHLIFGYLQIGVIYHDLSLLPEELHYHPHAQNRFLKNINNSIYQAIESLSFLPSHKGAGCLNYNDGLVLTKQGYSKSKWHLPEFFRDVEISYHSQKSFTKDYFQSATKGQEFVIEENKYIADWGKTLIINAMK